MHCCQHCVRVPVSPPLPCLSLAVFFIVSILESTKWYLLCICLVTQDVKNHFTDLLAFHISSLEVYDILHVYSNFLTILIEVFVFLLLCCKSSLYILHRNPGSDVWSEVFSLSLGCLLTLLMISFEAPKFFTLMIPNLSIFSFVVVLLLSYLRNHFLIQGHEDSHL